TQGLGVLKTAFVEQLMRTRFLGVGNPAESGTHLLYVFRQENELAGRLFINTHQIFDSRPDAKDVKLAEPDVSHYVFLDDFCGLGDQATQYSDKVVSQLKDVAKRQAVAIDVAYYVLFGTKRGLDDVKKSLLFDRVGAVFEL